MVIRNRAVAGRGHQQGWQDDAFDRPEIDEAALVDEIQRLGRIGQAGTLVQVKGSQAMGLEFFKIDGWHCRHSTTPAKTFREHSVTNSKGEHPHA